MDIFGNEALQAALKLQGAARWAKEKAEIQRQKSHGAHAAAVAGGRTRWGQGSRASTESTIRSKIMQKGDTMAIGVPNYVPQGMTTPTEMNKLKQLMMGNPVQNIQAQMRMANIGKAIPNYLADAYSSPSNPNLWQRMTGGFAKATGYTDYKRANAWETFTGGRKETVDEEFRRLQGASMGADWTDKLDGSPLTFRGNVPTPLSQNQGMAQQPPPTPDEEWGWQEWAKAGAISAAALTGLYFIYKIVK